MRSGPRVASSACRRNVPGSAILADVHTPTITNTGDNGAEVSEGPLFARVVFVAHAHDRGLRSSAHGLDGIDEVRFRRGGPDADRRGRVLTLAVPDDRMSSDHARLVRREARWMLIDDGSKNGSVVNGAHVRKTLAGDGAVLELGRSFFVLRSSIENRVPARLAGDLDAGDLPVRPRGMATFEPGLAHDFDAIVRVASSKVAIAIHGETGTGKELLAQAIHDLSGRPGELVAVNCGALPPTLIESELFGHRKGSFTGAVTDRRGLARSADRGTLFLDEVGELPLPAQPAFLRVLEQHVVVPVGDDRPIAVDLRVVSATLRDLDEAVVAGRFRSDLQARIVGHAIELPALRERREDLGLLITALLPEIAPELRPGFAPTALRALLRHDWPKNIRELRTTLATATQLAGDGTIEAHHLPAAVVNPRSRAALSARTSSPSHLSDADRELRAKLVEVLAAHHGNVVAAARALGKRRTQVYKWIARLGIELSTFRGPDADER
jgi:sigma-54 dependent transcriptional regulator, acetoin dehydrogenase operon transcriptional activator AcoR